MFQLWFSIVQCFASTPPITDAPSDSIPTTDPPEHQLYPILFVDKLLKRLVHDFQAQTQEDGEKKSQHMQNMKSGVVLASRSLHNSDTAHLSSFLSTATPTLERRLESEAGDIGRGFHRQLRTTLHLTSQEPKLMQDPEQSRSIIRSELEKCELMIQEHIPNTMYADLYQLAQISRFHARPRPNINGSATLSTSLIYPFRAVCEQDIELERPSEVSRSYTMLIDVSNPEWNIELRQSTKPANSNPTSSPSSPSSFSSSSSSLDASITLRIPIHARYQAAGIMNGASSISYAEARLHQPTIFIRCGEVTGHGWAEVRVPQRPEYTVTMQVPIGTLDHLPVIRVVTFGLTLLSAIFLCALSIWKSRQTRSADAHTYTTQHHED